MPEIKNKRTRLIFILSAVILILIFIIVVVMQATKEPPKPMPIVTTTSTTVTSTTTTTTTIVTTSIPYQMKLDKKKAKDAHEVNNEAVGWIYIDDTVVDYPVVQGEDNDKYIHLDWKGVNYNYAGCIFEDYRGKIEGTANTLFYGHNMAAGTMFAAIRNYEDEDWGKKHQYIEVADLDKRYLYKVIACSVLNGNAGASFQYWNYEDLNEDEFKEYTDQIKSTASIYYSSKIDEPKWGDKIIALQTCQTGGNDGIRCVVFAKSLGEH